MELSQKAIHSVNNSKMAFCKFLSANDVGTTGTHQAGIYITKNAISMLFDEPGKRGETLSREIGIFWQEDFYTNSRFVYYGCGTRNEYRITRFGRGFPFLQPEHLGDLFVLVKVDYETYNAYVLSSEEEINEFLDAYSLSPSDTGSIITRKSLEDNPQIKLEIDKYLNDVTEEFPSSILLSKAARHIYNKVYNYENEILINPDNRLVSWLNLEYLIFKYLEISRYSDALSAPFEDVDKFLEFANVVLNRRKSRAGKSLENHLRTVFSANDMNFEFQPTTEGYRKPDFLFPGDDAYRNISWPDNKLVFLGAKTTCKDRWRQILSEAGKIKIKHLFTLQQGISSRQLHEMEEENVVLVVPKEYHNAYPKEYRDKIMSLKTFIEYTKEKTKY